MILHIAGLDKFIPPFIEFIGQNFDLAQHRFWLNGDRNRYPYQDNPSTYQVKPGVLGKFGGYLRLVVDLNKAEKVILHGLFNPKIILLLSCMPWLLQKCYWIIWGGDLYEHQLGKKTVKWHVIEVLKKFTISKIGSFVTQVKGDYELARKWYGAKGSWHECFVYTSNLYKECPATQKPHEEMNILLGNSAAPSNNHIEILERLQPILGREAKIYCPLSYGDFNYAKEVEQAGEKLFGERFIALHDFMSFDKYLELLENIDIAIFNHRRQQAMGNITTLLGLGKTVYINSSVTSWEAFKILGVKVFDTEMFDGVQLEEKEKKENNEKISSYFSEENLKNQLRSFLN